jgi:hypothetical protein
MTSTPISPTIRTNLLHEIFQLSPTEASSVDDVIVEWLIAARLAEPTGDDSFIEFATSLIPILAEKRIEPNDESLKQRLTKWNPNENNDSTIVSSNTPPTSSSYPIKDSLLDSSSGSSSITPSLSKTKQYRHDDDDEYYDDDETDTIITMTTSTTMLTTNSATNHTANQQQQQQQRRFISVDPRIESLRGLSNNSTNNSIITDEFLSYLLFTLCVGDVNEAASQLLDAETTAHALSNYSTYMFDLTKLEKEKEEKERLAKQRVIEKFDERIEGGNAIASKVKKNTSTTTTTTGVSSDGSKESKLRYRDGKIVATNGAKFIMENVKEEWDGGSRGKIKTKGKRGKGWVDG